MSDHAIAILTLIFLFISAVAALYAAYLAYWNTHIQIEQTGEYREQTEIMRADAMGPPCQRVSIICRQRQVNCPGCESKAHGHLLLQQSCSRWLLLVS